MIRVYRVAPDLFTAPVRDPPILEARTLDLLEHCLETNGHGLSAVEVEAVRRATKSLNGADLVSIVVAAGGSVFRLERRSFAVPQVAAQAPSSAKTEWSVLTRHRGAVVLAASADVAWNERACDALQFLGYDAHPAGESATLEIGNVANAVRRHRPAVVLLGSSLWATEGARVREAAGSGAGIVFLVASGAPQAPLPAGVDGSLELPLRVTQVAPVVDRVIGQRRGFTATPPETRP